MKERLLAFYLPQFHQIPENDIWWGKGFTEWTNVRKARPLFPGHYQPKVPADLGYYDLRVPETRQAQADMAREYGIEGFIYWHYWFGNGKRLLERPFNEVLESGKPEFPFALAWANEPWKGFSHGLRNERQILIDQKYGGETDYTEHFNTLLPAFKDSRYLTVEGKPIFLVYRPMAFNDISDFIGIWRKLAMHNGLPGIYFIAMTQEASENDQLLAMGFDGVNVSRLFEYFKYRKSFAHAVGAKILKLLFNCPNVTFYKDASRYFVQSDERRDNIFPTACSNWDHSPRTGRRGIIMLNSSPKAFKKHLRDIREAIKDKDHDHSLVFVKSWNEWGEGNYLEPDMKYGKGFLEVIPEVFK